VINFAQKTPANRRANGYAIHASVEPARVAKIRLDGVKQHGRKKVTQYTDRAEPKKGAALDHPGIDSSLNASRSFGRSSPSSSNAERMIFEYSPGGIAARNSAHLEEPLICAAARWLRSYHWRWPPWP
jgi:hypothetical protein